MENASAKTRNGNPYHRFPSLQTADVCIYPYPTGLKTRGYSFSRLPDVFQLRSSFIAPPTPSLLITHHSLLTAQKPVLMFICLISKEICGHLSHLRNLCAIVKRRTLNECRDVACSVRGFYSRKSRESRQRLRVIFRESVRL